MTTKPKHAASTETAAGSDRFDVAALRELAGEKVFVRGVAYHEDGHVEIVTLDEARVLASVEGSEVYRCELVGSGTAFSGMCSCRAFDDWGFCKHLLATALAANCLGPEELEQAAGRAAKIREHLRAKGVEKLVEMIIGIAARDPSLQENWSLRRRRPRPTTRCCLRSSRSPSPMPPAPTAMSNIARCLTGWRGSS